MKRLTIDQTWTKCLKMWRWIVRERRKSGYRADVQKLKEQYFAKKRFKPSNLCWFCEYNDQHGNRENCDKCLGAIADKVNNRYAWCNMHYDWQRRPIAFLAELNRLNRIRRAKK